ncbi:MAG TPA: SPOR domain-containing protein [Candidatus Saccharimonadales bacterium]|jgi:cell division septation protein DedD|nr:SPOR domain-containing protein [Candidatus Saccharimonadales bacterium]
MAKQVPRPTIMNYHLSFDKKTASFILVLAPLTATLIFFAGYRLGLDRGFHRAQAELTQQPASAPALPGPLNSQGPAEPGTTPSASTGASATPETESIAAGPQSASTEPLQPGGPITAKEDFTVQIGAFRADDPAQQLKEKFSGRGYSAFVFEGKDSKGQAWYVVRIGHFKQLEPATREAVIFTMREKMPAYVRPLNEL